MRIGSRERRDLGLVDLAEHALGIELRSAASTERELDGEQRDRHARADHWLAMRQADSERMAQWDRDNGASVQERDIR